jgi:hypothetical protein
LKRQHRSPGQPRDDPGHLSLGWTIVGQEGQEPDTTALASLGEDLRQGFLEPV